VGPYENKTYIIKPFDYREKRRSSSSDERDQLSSSTSTPGDAQSDT
jgi:hypothetical protein